IPDYDDYNSWVRYGLAIRGALGDDGEALFHEWSAQSAKYQPEVAAAHWRSFRPERIGAGTLYRAAYNNGWQPAPDLILRASIAAAEGIELRLRPTLEFPVAPPSAGSLEGPDGPGDPPPDDPSDPPPGETRDPSLDWCLDTALDVHDLRDIDVAPPEWLV